MAGGVGVVGFATFAVFGALNNSTFSKLEDECLGGSCRAEDSEMIDRGRRQQLIANAGAVVGIVGLGVGATLFVLSKREQRSLELGLVAGPGSIGMKGRFQ